MAAIAKSGTPSVASTLVPHTEQIPGLLAGEAIAAGDLCTIDATGVVLRSLAGDQVHGVAAMAAAAGEAITLYRNVRFGYGAALTPGTVVRLSGAVAGGLDDAGAEQIVGYVVDATRIQFIGL